MGMFGRLFSRNSGNATKPGNIASSGNDKPAKSLDASLGAVDSVRDVCFAILTGKEPSGFNHGGGVNSSSEANVCSHGYRFELFTFVGEGSKHLKVRLSTGAPDAKPAYIPCHEKLTVAVKLPGESDRWAQSDFLG